MAKLKFKSKLNRCDSGQALRRSVAGQATVEYIMILSVVVALFAVLAMFMKSVGIENKFLKGVRENFARTYQYGHPKAKGFDDGGPEMHPRVNAQGNFRIFINPRRI